MTSETSNPPMMVMPSGRRSSVPGPVAIDKLDDSALPPPKGAFPGNKGTTKP